MAGQYCDDAVADLTAVRRYATRLAVGQAVALHDQIAIHPAAFWRGPREELAELRERITTARGLTRLVAD